MAGSRTEETNGRSTGGLEAQSFFLGNNFFMNILNYSVSTNVRQELIEPSAREVFIIWTQVEM